MSNTVIKAVLINRPRTDNPILIKNLWNNGESTADFSDVIQCFYRSCCGGCGRLG